MKRSISFRGFTLIELLVVIAIIGILSSVVLASLVLARQRGADAAVKSNLHTIQTQAEVYYSNNSNTYGPVFACGSSVRVTIPGVGANFFISDPTINNALKTAFVQSPQGCWAVGQGGGTYAVEVMLQSGVDAGKFWCIDNSGVPKIETVISGGNPNLGGGAGADAACP